MHLTYKYNCLFILCTLFALLVPLDVNAQPERGSELTISAALKHFDYQEFSDNGKLLDREEGYIPGLAFGLSESVNRWVLAGDIGYHNGDTAYSGYTNSGIPITTTTRQNIVDIAMRAEYWLSGSKGRSYALYLGTGYHQWQRNILPTTTASGSPVSGLFETYAWWTGFAGIKTELFDSAYGLCMMDIRLLQTLNPTIDVNFNGTYDRANLALGERWGVRLALPWRYPLNRLSGLQIEPYYEYHEFGRSTTAPLTSNGSVVGTVFEPFSQTFNYGLLLGVSQRF